MDDILEQQSAFVRFRIVSITPSILECLDIEERFSLDPDASNTGISGILFQIQN